ncbi:MAG TPA: hypothetical protein VMZ22_12530 [Acidimicrobiales bacterium]|nr:hypothetical protein [Acidimicrobiales bacterium]
MRSLLLVAGLLLGPLLLARVRHFAPAPGGIVVSPTAPKLDMRVVIDAPPDDPASKPLVATLTGQRPQPSNEANAGTVVRIESQVQLASPEALDRIDAALTAHPHIAVYPWQKTAERAEALSMFFALLEAMTLTPKAPPTALVASRADADTAVPPVIYFGGHIVAERPAAGWTKPDRSADPFKLVAALFFFATVAAAATQLAVAPSFAHFGWYAAAVFSLSLCIRQIGKYARLATLVYPISLVCFVFMSFRGLFVRR